MVGGEGLFEGFDFSANPTAHGDGCQVRGIAGLQIINTVYDMGPWQRILSGGTNYAPKNAAIYFEAANGGPRNVLIDTLWINGGGYSFYHAAMNGVNVTLKNARVGRDYGYGPINSAHGPVTLQNNVWDDNGTPVPGMNN